MPEIASDNQETPTGEETSSQESSPTRLTYDISQFSDKKPLTGTAEKFANRVSTVKLRRGKDVPAEKFYMKEPPVLKGPFIEGCLEAGMSELSNLLFRGAVRLVVVEDDAGPISIVSREVKIIDFKTFLNQAYKDYQAGKMDSPYLQFFTPENLLKAGLVNLTTMLFLMKENDARATNVIVFLDENNPNTSRFGNLDHGQKGAPINWKLSTDSAKTTHLEVALRKVEQNLGRTLTDQEITEVAKEYPSIPITESFSISQEILDNFPYQQDAKGNFLRFSMHWITEFFTSPELLVGENESAKEDFLQFINKSFSELIKDPEFQKQTYKYFLKYVLLDEGTLRSAFAKHIPTHFLTESYALDEIRAFKEKGIDVNQTLLSFVTKDFEQWRQNVETVLKNRPEFRKFLIENPNVIIELLQEFQEYNQDPDSILFQVELEQVHAKFQEIAAECLSIQQKEEEAIVSEVCRLATQIYQNSLEKTALALTTGCKSTMFATPDPKDDEPLGQALPVLVPSARVA